MKNYLGLVTAVAVVSVTLFTQAQPQPQPRTRGGAMGGAANGNLAGAMSKFFGEHSNFSANIEMQSKDPQGNDMSMPGKFAFSDGKARMEMNMSEMKGGKLPPQALAQMKAMGMDAMVVISRPDKKVSDMIYPGMKAYVETPMSESEAASSSKDDSKVELTELGKETVDGHPCVKNKAVVTDKTGQKGEATIWNATDLKKFPVKIQQTEQGQNMTMTFKDVQFAKPDAAQFEVPAGLKKYANPREMMMEIMSKQFGAGPQGVPPTPPTPPAPAPAKP